MHFIGNFLQRTIKPYIVYSFVVLLFYFLFLYSLNNRWLPVMKLKKGKSVSHQIFCTINLFIASCFAYYITKVSILGHTYMQFNKIEDYGVLSVLNDLVFAVLYQSVLEYYWHRYTYYIGSFIYILNI